MAYRQRGCPEGCEAVCAHNRNRWSEGAPLCVGGLGESQDPSCSKHENSDAQRVMGCRRGAVLTTTTSVGGVGLRKAGRQVQGAGRQVGRQMGQIRYAADVQIGGRAG